MATPMKRWTVTIILATLVVAGVWNEGRRLRAWSLREAAELAFYDGDLASTMAAYSQVQVLLPGEPYSYIDEADSIAISLETGLINNVTEDEVEVLVTRGIQLYLKAIRLSPPGAWSYSGIGRLAGSLAMSRQRSSATDLTAFSTAPLELLRPEDRLQEAALAHAVRIESQNYFYRDHLADFYLRKGFSDRAVQHFRETARIQPVVESHFYLSDYIKRLPIVRDAVALGINDALEEGTTGIPDERIHRSLAQVYLRQGRLEDARASFRAAAESSSHPQMLEIQIGQTLLKENDLLGALAAFRRSTELESGYFRSWLYVGRTLDLLGRSNEAVAALRKARALKPILFQPGFQLAGALINAGQEDEAARILERLVVNHPERQDASLRLIAIYQGQQAWGNATRVARMLAEKYPDEPVFKQRVEQLQLAREGIR